mmetsp:Transcript_3693/g.8786  ORF Transcript_3693/g.8786 Transcript_3693/m.8786 type:complete len:88 (-) Transcript_3693:788-1051(-)
MRMQTTGTTNTSSSTTTTITVTTITIQLSITGTIDITTCLGTHWMQLQAWHTFRFLWRLRHVHQCQKTWCDPGGRRLLWLVVALLLI